MTQLDDTLFTNTTAPLPRSSTSARGRTVAINTSELIERPSKEGKGSVKYVRLSDVDHKRLCDFVTAVMELRADLSNPYATAELNAILDKRSGIYGKQIQKWSTLGDVLVGVAAKLKKRHKYVVGRMGEDLSAKQLGAINAIMTAVGSNVIVIPKAVK
ncbi:MULTISPECIES: hypothetical protein [unclassified Rhizobium]|uniref:hypothetical protein n=1 Tax=unclassified Rhizobium TaxID=2613769 RepID=UPI00115CB6E8|nr:MULTISPECIES: hypothetical protein [unclassified Rhizobium]TQX90247.1 hypothetical protein EQW76_11125 [Rhizobium sp. rho-13.1]TQY16197.1 hypothetical protein EQW74_10715 [Rhizobium sp. rho-1.1]